MTQAKSEERFAVQSEKYPGEARAYWVVDLAKPYRPQQSYAYRKKVGEFYDTLAKARRECKRLNAERS